MKIATNRDILLPPLLQVGNVVERRQTLPILANVLIKVESGRITFIATDLEVELETRIEASTEESAEFTLPARKFIDICKALPESAEINISIAGEKATIRSGRGRYTLGMLPATDYPSIEPASVTQTLKIREGDLKQLLEQTQFAMAQQDVRYYLNGLLLEAVPKRIRAVATDGHRLALSEIAYKGKVDSEMQVIIPRKAVLELNRLLGHSENEVVLETSSSHIQIHLGNTSFTSKLIDGRYPDYNRVLPSGDTHDLVADKEQLRQTLVRAAILSNEKYRGITFMASKDMLRLKAHNPEQDEAEEEMEIKYSGPEINIGFNVGYLIDVLGVLSGENVCISLIDGNSSSLITSTASDAARYVVMPMRI